MFFYKADLRIPPIRMNQLAELSPAIHIRIEIPGT